jgi:hypothetical protein
MVEGTKNRLSILIIIYIGHSAFVSMTLWGTHMFQAPFAGVYGKGVRYG